MTATNMCSNFGGFRCSLCNKLYEERSKFVVDIEELKETRSLGALLWFNTALHRRLCYPFTWVVSLSRPLSIFVLYGKVAPQ